MSCRNIRWSLLTGLVILAWPTIARCGEGPGPGKAKGLPGVEVVLRFSVEEFDPLKPGRSFLECVVRNKSDKAIKVPVLYSGGYDSDMVLSDGTVRDLRLIVWAGPKDKATKLVGPGEELTIFKESLREVLLLDVTEPKALIPEERRYYWTWQA